LIGGTVNFSSPGRGLPNQQIAEPLENALDRGQLREVSGSVTTYPSM
jgi:hypothetical protein